MKPRKPVAPELPTIPSNIRLGGSGPKFARIPEIGGDGWLLLGRESELPLGQLVEIQQYTTQDVSTVEVLEYVAERNLRHRAGSYSRQIEGPETRWVLATFTSHPELDA